MFVSEAVWQRILEKLKKTLVGLEAYRSAVQEISAAVQEISAGRTPQ